MRVNSVMSWSTATAKVIKLDELLPSSSQAVKVGDGYINVCQEVTAYSAFALRSNGNGGVPYVRLMATNLANSAEQSDLTIRGNGTAFLRYTAHAGTHPLLSPEVFADISGEANKEGLPGVEGLNFSPQRAKLDDITVRHAGEFYRGLLEAFANLQVVDKE